MVEKINGQGGIGRRGKMTGKRKKNKGISRIMTKKENGEEEEIWHWI